MRNPCTRIHSCYLDEIAGDNRLKKRILSALGRGPDDLAQHVGSEEFRWHRTHADQRAAEHFDERIAATVHLRELLPADRTVLLRLWRGLRHTDRELLREAIVTIGMAGLPAPVAPSRGAAAAPRLTEPWFC